MALVRQFIFRQAVFVKSRTFLLIGSLLFASLKVALANGGAWQVGVPLTGNAAPSDKTHSTNVSIEDEKLTIDLQ